MLNDKICRNAKPENKPYKLKDSGGMFLLIHPNGSKYWQMKYRVRGISKKTGEEKLLEKLLSFGKYPLVSLKEAREERDKAKKLLLQDIDPAKEKEKDKKERIRNAHNTFKAVAIEWHDKQKSAWSESHADNVMHRLETDIFPYIGDNPIIEVEAPDLLDALRIIEKRGALDLAGRARQICGQVFRYGIQTGRCKRDPSHDLRGALATRKTKHFPAIDTKEIPQFLKDLERNDARLFARTRRAIKLSMLVFLRPKEIRQARWQDIDIDNAEWIVPAHIMKMKRDHIVPLSKQVIEILEEQHEETGMLNSPWVFPSQIKPINPMSNGTVNVALKKLGYHGKQTAHGWRAVARTAIREKLKYPPDVIEAQLAHKAAGALGEAYNRAQHLDERKIMMQDWADYIDEAANQGEVVSVRFG